MITANDLWWAAGFLEGEGSFRSRLDSGLVMVQVGQVQLEPLERLSAMFGGSIILRPSRRLNQQASYQWSLAGISAAGLMMTVHGLMSPRRKDQIIQALFRWRSHKPRCQYRTTCPLGHSYIEYGVRVSRIRNGKSMQERSCLKCRQIKDAGQTLKRKRVRLLAQDRVLTMQAVSE